MTLPDAEPTADSAPKLAAAARIWGKIGILSFGGPAAQIALMHKLIVDEKRWLGEKQFLNALSFCMLLPGPEAMQLATYMGWRLHGILGGLIAGILFVLPGAAVILALASLYVQFGDVPLVKALFVGIKAVVVVIVIEALLRVSKKALGTPLQWMIALAAFVGIFFLTLPYPLLVLLAGICGFVFLQDKNGPAETLKTSGVPITKTLATIGIWLIVWWLPLGLIWVVGGESVLIDIGLFFSKLAVVTFGGAYAVLAYMAQQAVEQFGWLSAGAMMDGLGLAETTPGPLILVTEFVGFLAAHQEGGIMLALAGTFITLWVTFAPCFLWIFVGAPYIEWISNQPRLSGALAAITAAVVGVILNLSVWFALHVFFGKVDQIEIGILTLWVPDFSTVSWIPIAIAGVGIWALLFRHVNLLIVLAGAAIAGLALSWI